MVLSVLTVFAAAALGGAVAIDIQGFVIAAVIALVLLGVLNGLRMLGNLSRVLRA